MIKFRQINAGLYAEIIAIILNMIAIPALQYNYPLARPVVKWVGGKSQLLQTIKNYLPTKLKMNAIKRYIEPFLGGGAVFFELVGIYDFDEVFLFDTNPELIIMYNVIKNDVEELIKELQKIQDEYFTSNQKLYYYDRRDEYNKFDKKIDANKYSKKFVRRAALTIFLNRTCFNGLFRVNSKGLFNVPMGRYNNPKILDSENLRNASMILQNAVIMQADFSVAMEYANKDTFIYYDPPYRPIRKTSSFNSYSVQDFDDIEQVRLYDIFTSIDRREALQMLSNSDPTNYIKDTFFDDLYSNFNIHRVNAKRLVNSDPNGRGEVRELLITNY